MLFFNLDQAPTRTPEERKAWLDTLKDEGTKQIVRGIWDTLWDKLTS